MPDHSPLRRAIYRSESLLRGTESEIGAELARILVASCRHNAESGVTGALLLRDSVFVQVLEGPAQSVADTLARIEADPRHNGITMLQDGEVAERVFATWSMAYAGEDAQSDIPLTLSLLETEMTEAQSSLLAELRTQLG